MVTLNPRERELVALGAALASNCIPCIEFHIKEARKAELTDAEIAEAIGLADQVRRVPAGKVLDAASALLSAETATPMATPVSCRAAARDSESCC